MKNGSAQRKALDILTCEYKNKGWAGLNAIDDGGLGYYYQHEGRRFWVEVQVDKKISGVVRVCVSIKPDGFWGWAMGRARYFGVTEEDKIVENNDMFF